MRIAAVQLRIVPSSRTHTLQRALAAIDEVAGADPAPDLIVLPAFSDVFDIAAGGSSPGEKTHGQTMAACGVRARSWGLFIALAIAERATDKSFVTGLLLDCDGDICLEQRQVSFDKSQTAAFAAGDGFATADILLGRFAMLVGDDVLDGSAWDAALRAGVQCVIATTCRRRGRGDRDTASDIGDRVAAHAARCGLPCAVADVTTGNEKTGGDCPGFSVIVDGRGKTLAKAEAGAGAILRADVVLPEARQVQCDGERPRP